MVRITLMINGMLSDSAEIEMTESTSVDKIIFIISGTSIFKGTFLFINEMLKMKSVNDERRKDTDKPKEEYKYVSGIEVDRKIARVKIVMLRNSSGLFIAYREL
jgi:hypothetical protein